MQKHQATIKEIAAALDVSTSTVSRALQDDPRIGLRTRARVQELAQKLHYVPNPAAKLLRQNRTLTIGVVLPFLREEFFSLAITGIEDITSERGYNVVVSQSRDQFERESKAVHSFIRSRVDGVIASLAAGTSDNAHFAELQDFGIPVVFFDRVPKNFPGHSVRCKIVAGMMEAMQYLSGRGFTKIALLNGPPNLEASQERLAGFQASARGFGLEISPGFLKFTDLTLESTLKGMAELCAGGQFPQAIVTFNDYVALHAMHWCKQNGLVPNRDIVFVSFANLPITAYLDNPPAASVEQFAYQMGMRAAEILMEVLDKPDEELAFREVVLDTKLMVRD